MQVTGHDGHTTAVDGAQVGVGQHGDHVGLGGLLEGQDGGAGEAETILVVAGQLTDQTLEGSLAEQQVGALLEAFHLSQRDGPSVPAPLRRLLHAGGGLGGLLAANLLGLGGLAGGVLTNSVWGD